MSVTTRVYDDYEAARNAVNEVNALGLPNVDVSILGNESIRDYYASEYPTDYPSDMTRDAVTGRPVMDGDTDASGTATGAGIGAAIGGGAGLLTGLGMLAIPGVGPLVAAGWFAAAAVGAAGGALAGGAVGAIVDLGLSEEDAPVFSEAIRRGGVAVSVRFPESDRSTVQQALDRVSTTTLVDRRTRYEAEGRDSDETTDDRDTRTRDLPPVDPINRIF